MDKPLTLLEALKKLKVYYIYSGEFEGWGMDELGKLGGDPKHSNCPIDYDKDNYVIRAGDLQKLLYGNNE